MVHNGVTDRTFFVRFKESTGTAFAVDVEGRQYLVSASHVFPEVKGKFEIELMQDMQWITIPVELVGTPESGADVIVLAPKFQLATPYNMELAAVKLMFGQEVFFLGFPYGLFTEDTSDEEGVLPYPFVKKAVISARTGPTDESVWFLDGLNNPGFSGGPVITKDPFKPASIAEPFHVMSIISAYRTSEDVITDGNKDYPIFSRGNSGIIVSLDACIAKKIILERPIGFEIP